MYHLPFILTSELLLALMKRNPEHLFVTAKIMWLKEKKVWNIQVIF